MREREKTITFTCKSINSYIFFYKSLISYLLIYYLFVYLFWVLGSLNVSYNENIIALN